jgi:hypothetical protein
MAWIETISDAAAEGPLRQLFDAARPRAGRVFNIVRVPSSNPPVLKAGLGALSSACISRATR